MPRDTESVPEAVRRRFVHVGRDYYFEDGTKAFRDHGGKLVSASENTEVVRNLVAIALEREWNDVTVAGTRRFRHEAWRQATMVGLTVRGYRPSEFERAKLVRDLARARGASTRPQRREDPAMPQAHESRAPHSTRARPRPRPEASAAPETREPPPARDESTAHLAAETRSPGTLPDSPGAATPVPPEPTRTGGKEHGRATGARELAGVLVRHSAGPYRWQPNGEPSYFVTVRTGKRERTLWGVDLERALKESKSRPEVGDEVVARRIGREPVTVLRRRRDAEGAVVGEEEITAERNRWIVEKRAFLDERAMLARLLREPAKDPPDEVRQLPALASAYLTLKTAGAFAKERIGDSENRAAFLAAVREHLARRVEEGEAIAPPRIRERVSPAQGARVPERAAPVLG